MWQLSLVLSFFLLCAPAFADYQIKSDDIRVDASQFATNLSENDTTVQKALETVDGMSTMVYPGAGLPVSTGSAWGTSITNNSSNWNTAYGWGNHASAGYVTGTPWTSMGYVTGTPWTSAGYYVGDGSAFATSAQGSSADTAYGWGDHSKAGYLTAVPDVTYSKAFIITNPTASADALVWSTPEAITITAFHVYAVGGTSITGGLWENDTVAVSDDVVAPAEQNTNNPTLTNPVIDAGNGIFWQTTSVSGTVTRVTVTFDYTVNA